MISQAEQEQAMLIQQQQEQAAMEAERAETEAFLLLLSHE